MTTRENGYQHLDLVRFAIHVSKQFSSVENANTFKGISLNAFKQFTSQDLEPFTI
jgi:hypothetical protein